MAALNRCCSFNCRGWNSGSVFLKDYLDSFDLCFVQEHWLHSDHLNQINSINSDFLSVSVSGMDSGSLVLLFLRNTDTIEDVLSSLGTQPSRDNTTICHDEVEGVTDFAWLLLPVYYLPLVALCTVGGVWIVHKGRQVSIIISCYDSVQVIICTHVYIAIMQLHCSVIKHPLLTFVGITILL